ncbi:MAG: endo-1,4-beta-xylanase [Bacteroidaceae bacterium]|nr:endo-1,4-beta-xylanase [Bacteroidaceae bacterium]
MQKLKYYILSCLLPACAAVQAADNVPSADKTINFCKATADYVSYADAIAISAGKTYNVITSRYSYWTSTVTGSGTMNILSGGERCYLGSAKGASFPNWKNFKGDVHLYPYKSVVSSAGFYGLIWAHGGKTFNPEEVEASISGGKLNDCFANNVLTMHSGAALAAESGNRAIRIGRLEMEEGSQLYGYYKKSDTPKTYYVVGGNGQDATLAGRISPMDDNLKEGIGLVKEGKGTYRITGNRNSICGCLRVLDGRVLVNNDAAQAKQKKLTGGVGVMYNTADAGVFVMQNSTIGGVGNIACLTDVYGTIEPGDDGVGTLTFADYAKGGKVTLRVRPTTNVSCEIESQDSYDKVVVTGAVDYYNIDQKFMQSKSMPKVTIRLKDEASLNVGDTFTLMTYSSRASYNNVEWAWNVVCPKRYTWKVEEQKTNGGYALVATVVSLDDSGQDAGGEDETGGEGDVVADEWDYNQERKFGTALSMYANKLNKYVGVAVRGWSMDLNNDNDAQVSLIAKQFNAVVAENEMKYDAVEPSEGYFSYGDGDKLVNFARRHSLRVRGHNLAWHQQVPAWLTEDGKKNTKNRSRKELLALLKNHIMNVVGHWKGKIAEWDVCNEVLDDDQSVIRSNPGGYTMRQSVWKVGIGDDFVDSAFVWAHEADPKAVLVLNDYGVEFQGQAKAEAFYNLVKRLKERNIPIHGVGIQCHLDAGQVDVAMLRANIRRYKELGLVCNITELDLGIDDLSQTSKMKQADDYFAITRAFLAEDNCTTMMIWGLRDNESWRSSSPLLYDSSLQAKPAYYGVHAGLRKTYTELVTGVDEVTKDVEEGAKPSVTKHVENGRIVIVKDGKRYDLMGREVR